MLYRLRVAVGFLVLSVLFVYLSSPTLEAPSSLPDLTAGMSLLHLQQLREGAVPGSAEAAQLDRLIAKVRRKAHMRTPRAQDPGAFREALAQIKTRRDGTTYAPNYKIRELGKAKRALKGKGVPLPWVERGPGNVSGRSRAIVVDPDDPARNTWFVATVGGGIWKTTDAGATWQNKTPQLSTLSTTCLAMAAGNPDVMYAGTGMGYGRVVDLEGSGIWKSTDRGETWTQLASTANGELLDAINRIVVDPNDENVVVVCSNDGFSHLGPEGFSDRRSGIFRSTDGGLTWLQVYDPDAELGTGTDNRVQQIVADPTNFNNLYAAVNEVGVLKSTDAGVTWSVSADNFALPSDVGNPTSGGFGLAGISVRTELAIAPSDPHRIYAAVERPRGVGDLYVSVDAGDNWTPLTDTVGDSNWFNAFGVSGAVSYTAGWFDNTIAVHPYDEDVVFVGGVNLYRVDVNTAAGTRATIPVAWWIPNQVGLPIVHADHHWLEMIPVNESSGSFRILNANDGGIAHSPNGGVAWNQITGMGTTQFYGADKKPGQNVYIGGMQDNGTWFSGLNPTATSGWQFALGGDGFEVAWNANDGNQVLGGSQFNGLWKSRDAGASWNPVSNFDAGQSSPFITKIANGKTDPELVFVVGTAGLARSDDFGESWTQTSIPSRWLGYRPFDNVEISIADPQVVWATSRLATDPPSGLAGGIHVSTDGGLSFTSVSNNFPAALDESSGFATHPLDPDVAYALFSAPGLPKVLRTDDLGETWQDLSGFSDPAKANGFPDVAVFTLLVMPYDTDVMWAGTEIGLFVSEDAGASWQVSDTGLPNVAVFQLRIVEDQVIAATQGRGVWSVTLPELAGHEPPEVALAPRVLSAALSPAGVVRAGLDFRSFYDSTTITVNGSVFEKAGPNSDLFSLEILIPVTSTGNMTIQMTSFSDGRELKSSPKQVFAFVTQRQNQLSADFSAPAALNRWIANAFTVMQPPGFSDRALHSAHPYGTAADFTALLKTPVRVAESAALVSWDDVVLVEEGLVADYTNPNFFDYVILEGTSDGLNWQPLIAGYDSRSDPQWLQTLRQGGSGSASLYRNHMVDLLDTFAAGETIFLRFRLFSDPAVTGWGWAIDNLLVQTPALSLEDLGDGPPDRPELVTALQQNHPNPFNPITSIRYSVGRKTPVHLAIYNQAGQRVRELVNEPLVEAGEYEAVWNGVDDRGAAVASGIYFYRLATDARTISRKMTLVK